MGSIIVIRNRATKATCEISSDLWRQKKNTPEFRGVFEKVRAIKEPPEVGELRARLAAKALATEKKLL